MDYRYLKAFILAAKHGNFTRAAEELRIAQSAISRQIRLLEESLGAQLLFRSPQKVLLTPIGEDLYQEAGRFDEWLGNFFNKTIPTIRIGTLPGILENWLLQRLLRVSIKKSVNLNIETDSVAHIVKNLESGTIDIGFVSKKIDHEIITSRKIMDEEFILISKSKVDLNKLHEYRWIYSEKGDYLKKVSKKLSKNFIQVNSISTLLKMVEDGHGIAIVASHIVGSSSNLYKKPLENLKGSIYLAMPNYHILPNHLDRFVKEILALVKLN